MRSECVQSVFSFLRSSSIPFAVLRSYALLPETIEGGDVDLAINKAGAKRLIAFLRERYTITSVGVHVGIINIFLYLSPAEQLQIDLMFDFSYCGIPYLDVDDLLEQRVEYKGFYIPAPWHEYVMLLLPHFFYTGTEKEKYVERMDILKRDHSSEIETIHRDIFGHGNKRSVARFFWAQRGSWTQIPRHYSMELYKYVRQPYSQTVAFLGPDGAGKSTALEKLAELGIQFTKTTSHTHLKPQHLLKKRTQSRGVVTDPHGEDPRTSWTASLKLGIYVQEYWIEHFVHPQRNAHLKIYDRYIHDTMIDARRYRLEEGSMAPEWLSKFAPQPVVFVILNADPEIIQARKAEVSLEATRAQCQSYLDFAAQYPNQCAVVDANRPAEEVVKEIVSVMVQRLAEHADAQLKEICTRL